MAEHALDYALKACVWVKNDAGNYETIVPTNQPYFRNLSALAATLNHENSPLLKYEPTDDHWAHRVVVDKDYVAAHEYQPILMNFNESSLDPHPQNYTDALLYLLNDEWEKETSIARQNTSILHCAAHNGEMARGLYAFIHQALKQEPNTLCDWNGASIRWVEESTGKAHFHLGPELSSGLFHGGIEALMAWRRSLDPILTKKMADHPGNITITTDFFDLRAKLPPPPDNRVVKPEPKGKGLKGRKNDDPRQIDLDF